MNSIPTDLVVGNRWTFYFGHYRPSDERRREAIFAQGNGVIFTRASTLEARIDEEHYPGTYCAGCYEYLCSHVAGECDETESLANLPNWLSVRLRISGGEWWELNEAELLHYRHGIDLKAGITWREWTVSDRSGRLTRASERRLVSMATPCLGALSLKVVPLNWDDTVEVCSAIDGAVVNANVPRYRDYQQRHIETVSAEALSKTDMVLSARTVNSGVAIDEAVRTQIKGVAIAEQDILQPRSSIAQRFRFNVSRGKAFVVEKLTAICVSSAVGDQDIKECTARTLDQAGSFEQVRELHETAWHDLWQRAAINARNDDIALKLRFQAFHLMQTASPHSSKLDVGIPARGWHGEVYRGHIFWDELFVLPFFYFRFPSLAREILLYRYRRLNAARNAARAAGFQGAMFPWRSAYTGEEVTPRYQKNLISGHWLRDPTRLQRHIGSAVVFNVWRYYLTTGDYRFLSEYGAEIIFEVARFWASIAHYNEASERFEIWGVIGPDEYHNQYPDQEEPGLRNNTYTNLMAVWSLCCALELYDELEATDRQRITEKIDLTPNERTVWDTISRKMRISFQGSGVMNQFDGFENLRSFHISQLPPSLRHGRVDWALEADGESADDYQVCKQADTLTLFYLLPEAEIAALFSRLGYVYRREMLLRAADYYIDRSTHNSSLSQVVYAGALAYADSDRSWDFFRKSLATDLEALRGESTAEGVHLGAMGGTIDILQRCYVGIDVSVDGLRVAPAMPLALGEVELSLLYKGQHLHAYAGPEGVQLQSDGKNENTITVITNTECVVLAPGEDLFVGNNLTEPKSEATHSHVG